MTDRHKLAAIRRGTARTEKMELAVTEAMRTIQIEMQANGGIYPKNGGAMSMAELARRAGISESSFYKNEPGNVALKERSGHWLDTLKKKETVGRMQVKKNLAQRAEDWRQKYLALEQRHIRTELELQSLEAQIQLIRKQNASLLMQLTNSGRSNITPITVTTN